MQIRLNGRKNIYEEIVDEYERYIRAGALQEGEKLPSCRTLALALGINPTTVERAYAELERRGLVKTLPKKGAFVCGTNRSPLQDEARRQLTALKNAGAGKDELLSLIEEIYSDGGKKL